MGPRAPDNVRLWSRVALDAQGKAYFGSDGQGVTIFDGSSAQQLMLKDSLLATNNVQAIAEDKSGRVWMLTNKGAYRDDPSDEKAKWELFTSDNSGLSASAANVLYADPHAGIWFGGYEGASFFDGATWKHITLKDNALLDDDIRAIVIDAQGRNWFGGPKGLSVWDGKTSTTLNKLAGLPDEDIQTLLANGAIVWAGTRGGGLLRFEAGKWQAFTKDNANLPSNDIRALALTKDGTLLVGTDAGLVRFDGQKASVPELGTETVISIALGKDGTGWAGTVFSGGYQHDGKQWQAVPTLPSNTILSVFVDHLGAVWFGTETAGLARYVPQNAPLASTAPTNTPPAGPQPTVTAAGVTLGAEQTMPNTGYTYRIPAAWQMVPFGLAIIAAPPDANSDTGPSITFVGGAQKDLLPSVASSATLDDQLNNYVTTWFNYGGKAQLSNRREVNVNGAPARSADLKWSTDKYDGLVGRIVFAQPSAGQVFLMVGGGTPDRWPTITPVMDAMLGSVRFNHP